MLAAAIALTGTLGVVNAVTLALAYAADEKGGDGAIRALVDLEVTLTGPAFGFSAIAFFAGVAVSAIRGEALPSWVAWSAGALALVFAVGLLDLFAADEEGGPLVVLIFVGFLGFLSWLLATSIVLLRRSEACDIGETPSQSLM